jgi:hypothetical protein
VYILLELSVGYSLFQSPIVISHPAMDDSAIKPALYPASTVETDLKPTAQVGRDHIDLRPHESYEGAHRWDPLAEWTSEEEARVVRKTDLFLLSWICFMFLGLQLDRGNVGKLD